MFVLCITKSFFRRFQSLCTELLLSTISQPIVPVVPDRRKVQCDGTPASTTVSLRTVLLEPDMADEQTASPRDFIIDAFDHQH